MEYIRKLEVQITAMKSGRGVSQRRQLTQSVKDGGPSKQISGAV
jgi:hypothetical protein